MREGARFVGVIMRGGWLVVRLEGCGLYLIRLWSCQDNDCAFSWVCISSLHDFFVMYVSCLSGEL